MAQNLVPLRPFVLSTRLTATVSLRHINVRVLPLDAQSLSPPCPVSHPQATLVKELGPRIADGIPERVERGSHCPVIGESGTIFIDYAFREEQRWTIQHWHWIVERICSNGVYGSLHPFQRDHDYQGSRNT